MDEQFVKKSIINIVFDRHECSFMYINLIKLTYICPTTSKC